MAEYQGQAIKLVFKGQVLESEIHFTMGLDDGSWSTDLVAKKVSDRASIQPLTRRTTNKSNVLMPIRTS